MHLVRVDSNGLSAATDLLRRNKYIESRAAAQVNHSLALFLSVNFVFVSGVDEIDFEGVGWNRPLSASQGLSDSHSSTLDWHLEVFFPAPLPNSQRLWRPCSHIRHLWYWPRRCNAPAPFGKFVADPSSTSESLETVSRVW
jgi:hypothetical protein